MVNHVLTTAEPNGVVSDRITLADIESLAIPLVQEVVILADFRCSKCQKRVAEIMSRMNGETRSMEINVLEKTISLTTRMCRDDKKSLLTQQITRVYLKPWRKFLLIVRMFCVSRG